MRINRASYQSDIAATDHTRPFGNSSALLFLAVGTLW
jgi:hypothetical protein